MSKIFIGSNVLIITKFSNQQYLTTSNSDNLRGTEVEIINDNGDKVVLSGHQYALAGNVWEVAEILGVSE